MISRSDDYIAYCRENARHARDVHDLSLRGRHLNSLTELIYRQIADTVAIGPPDDLVEIGCGDGALLRIAAERGVHSAIGFLATDEEVSLLRPTGLDVRQALSHQLPLPDQCASVVICNNVLLNVPPALIPASLSEICRIARPDARIYIGEIPGARPIDPTPEFRTRSEALAYMYKRHGLRTWFGMFRRMAWWQLTGQPAVLSPGTATAFYASPEECTVLAHDAGMEVIRHWPHEHFSSRNNYLLRKIAVAAEYPRSA